MGAPAHRKVRSVGTPVPSSWTTRVRSVRKGVEAIVKLTPSSRIRAIARRGSQTSCSTELARSITGIMRPYMKPVWWAIGEAISTTSDSPSASRCA